MKANEGGLRECPLCKQNVKLLQWFGYARIECVNCRIRTTTVYYRNADEAIEEVKLKKLITVWNTRNTPSEFELIEILVDNYGKFTPSECGNIAKAIKQRIG